MSEHTPGVELVVPGIGEIVSLDDARSCAAALDGIRDLKRQLRVVENELTRALVYASQQQGAKTLHFEGLKVEIKGGSTTTYDAEAIEEGLREAGMPEERIREIVKETITYTVVAVKAKQAATANPAYAAVIDANKIVNETVPSATVSLKGASG